MGLAGRVLDIYDDTDGAVLRSIYPEGLPPSIKEAAYTEKTAAQQLPSDVFALHLQAPDGRVLRKYACSTPVDTILSVEYFLHQRDLLSPDLQKVAASNLLQALQEHELSEHPLLAKIAGIGSVVSNAFTGLASRVGQKVMSDPVGSAFKALGVAGTASALGGAAKDGAGALKNVAQAERAAGGFGRIV